MIIFFLNIQDEALIYKIAMYLGGQRMYVPKNLVSTIKPNVLHESGKPFGEYMSDSYGGEQAIFPVRPMAELKKEASQLNCLCLGDALQMI